MAETPAVGTGLYATQNVIILEVQGPHEIPHQSLPCKQRPPSHPAHERRHDGCLGLPDCVGIPRSSFYYIGENHPEAITEIQAIIDANNREQLGLIVLNKTEMLRKIIEDGLSDTTKPKDRLAIYLKLNELVDRLTDTLHVDSQLSKDKHAFLKQGPILESGKSRLTAKVRTITIETEE